MFHTTQRIATTAAALGAALLVTVSPAQATPTTTQAEGPVSPTLAVGEPSGQSRIDFPPHGSGTVTWDAKTKTVTITTDTKELNGQCLTTWFDWATNDGSHYDARAVRVCKSNTSRSHTWREQSNKVSGMHKLAVCYGPNNKKGTCKWDPGSVRSVGNPRFCNFSASSITVPSNAADQVCTGGDPTKPTS
jgi:hypothetical protein